MATKQQEELAALAIAAGIGAHAISDVISRGRLTRAETGLAIKIFKKIVPAAAGIVGREAVGLARLGARAVPMAARGAVTLGRFAARTNPYTLAALLAYEGYIHRDDIAAVAESLGVAEAPPEQAMMQREVAAGVQRGLIGGPSPVPGAIRAAKRKVSKANRAVKQGMKIIKMGTKASTGAPSGKYPKRAFAIVTKAAGLANPGTPSGIRIGKSVTMYVARKLKKWWK